MDSSKSTPEADVSIYSSPDSSAEPPKTTQFTTSISVSSLAEKFEKGDSLAIEDNAFAEGEGSETTMSVENNHDNIQINDSPSESVAVLQNGGNFSRQSKSMVVFKVNSSASEITSEGSKIDATCASLSGRHEMQSSNAMNGESSVTDKDTSSSCKSKSSPSAAVINGDLSPVNSSESSQEVLITEAVGKRVAFFAEKISMASQKLLREDDTTISGKELGNVPSTTKVANHISLRDLEQSFVDALHNANSEKRGVESPPDTLPVPCIKITEASDREDTSSEDSLEIISKDEPMETEFHTTAVSEMKGSDTKQTNIKEPIPSTSTASQCEISDDSEISAEERRALFYISSSDLPPDTVNDFLGNSDNLRQRLVNQEECTEYVTEQRSETRSPSCFCSKSVHGVIFITSFIVALLGFILYSLANEGKVPDFCQYLGLVTVIIAGVIGAFSCFCFGFIEAFPTLAFAGYEKAIAMGKNVFADKNTNFINLDEESWSSGKERDFRIQNGMSSTRTSTSSIRTTHSDRRELIKKTEKLKREVVGLLDSFSEMMAKYDPADEVSEMESGMANSRS